MLLMEQKISFLRTKKKDDHLNFLFGVFDGRDCHTFLRKNDIICIGKTNFCDHVHCHSIKTDFFMYIKLNSVQLQKSLQFSSLECL